jgi:hypothetical protein
VFTRCFRFYSRFIGARESLQPAPPTHKKEFTP